MGKMKRPFKPLAGALSRGKHCYAARRGRRTKGAGKMSSPLFITSSWEGGGERIFLPLKMPRRKEGEESCWRIFVFWQLRAAMEKETDFSTFRLSSRKWHFLSLPPPPPAPLLSTIVFLRAKKLEEIRRQLEKNEEKGGRERQEMRLLTSPPFSFPFLFWSVCESYVVTSWTWGRPLITAQTLAQSLKFAGPKHKKQKLIPGRKKKHLNS